MNRHTKQISFVTEAIANLQLLLSFLVHFRKQDDFISKQNIKAIL